MGDQPMHPLEVENRWRAAGLYYSTVLSSFLLIGFAVQHLLIGDRIAAGIALAGLPFMAATLAWSRSKPVMPAWTPYPAVGFMLVMLLFMLMLPEVFRGATLMWFCAVPPTTMLALRARIGLVISAVMFVVMAMALAVGDHELTEAYAARLGATYLFITFLMYTYERNRERVTQDLIEAGQRIVTLEGLLRICGWCHRRMRDDTGQWVSTERFFEDRAPVSFSHGICPDCQAKAERSLAEPAQ